MSTDRLAFISLTSIYLETRGRQTAAREHVFYINGMPPAKENFAKVFKNIIIFGTLVIFNQFCFMSL